MPKPDLRKSLGRKGELIAKRWLESRGYKLVKANYLIPGGQIDLVMYSPEGNLIFIEVKTRWATRVTRPPAQAGEQQQRGAMPSALPVTVEHSIKSRQIHALRRAADHFLADNPFPFTNWQLDLLWITLRPGAPVNARINHLQNVLEV